IASQSFRFQHDPGIEMDHAFAAESEAFLADRHMAREAAIEVFRGGLADPAADALPQGFPNIDILARNAKRHVRLQGPQHLIAGASVSDRGGPPAPPERTRHQTAAWAEPCFSRRRCTEEGMRIASRYLATVRLAISIPAPRSFSTMVSSESTSRGLSASMSRRMR